MERSRTRVVVSALIALTVLTAGCGTDETDPSPPSPSSSPRPSSTAKLAILSPENGSAVQGSTVDLELSLQGARVVKQTSSDLSPEEGHLHVLLDGSLIAMNYRLGDEIPDVGTGPHRIDVEFVASDHAPFDPRVTAVASFQVEP